MANGQPIILVVGHPPMAPEFGLHTSFVMDELASRYGSSRVLAAHTEEEMLAALGREQVKLIFYEGGCNLRQAGNHELLAKILQHRAGRPIIAGACCFSRENASALERIGDQAQVLEKPYGLGELSGAVAKYLPPSYASRTSK